MVDVLIRYVDGTEAHGTADDWPRLRADGVGEVVIRNESGPGVFGGHSLYWLYREGSLWVAGMASLAYDPRIPPEVLYLPDGTQATRTIAFAPDLAHSAVKLGWWWQ